jgi:hypothetical protein
MGDEMRKDEMRKIVPLLRNTGSGVRILIFWGKSTHQKVWDRFYDSSLIWRRFACTRALRPCVVLHVSSKRYRRVHAGTGISTDSARRKKSKTRARWTAKQCRSSSRPNHART